VLASVLLMNGDLSIYSWHGAHKKLVWCIKRKSDRLLGGFLGRDPPREGADARSLEPLSLGGSTFSPGM